MLWPMVNHKMRCDTTARQFWYLADLQSQLNKEYDFSIKLIKVTYKESKNLLYVHLKDLYVGENSTYWIIMPILGAEKTISDYK